MVEIGFGVVLGVLGARTSEMAPFLRFIADLGLALFLFLAGLEVDADGLCREGWRAAVPALAVTIVSFLLAEVAAFLLGWSPWVGLALSATSVPLLLSVVREAGLADAPLGREMVRTAVVGEVVSVGLVAFAEIVHHADTVTHGATGVLRLAGMLVLVVLGTRLLAVLRWWFPEGVQHLVGAGDPSESGVRAGFGLALLMIAVAGLAGVEPLLGAFAGGLMVAFTLEDRHAVQREFAPMAYGFFVPVFFVDVGVRLDVGELIEVGRPAALAGIVALMLLTKLVPSLAGLVVGRTFRTVLASAMLLAAPLTFLIAVATLAHRLDAIDSATEGTLILAGMIASLVYPSLARRLLGA